MVVDYKKLGLVNTRDMFKRAIKGVGLRGTLEEAGQVTVQGLALLG